MLRASYPLYLANRPTALRTELEVLDKYSGDVATRVARATSDELEQAIAAAHGASKSMASLPAHARRDVLEHCVRRFEERADELAMVLCIEAGKPVMHSRGEVARLIETFRFAAAEVDRPIGEVMALDAIARAGGYRGLWKRVPIGPCSFITPWNFPLNLVAHKVAPAIAAGCPFVLKPASYTPVSALILGEILAETELPAGAFSIVPCHSQDAGALITDERLRLLSFTGSHDVGWMLKAQAGRKRVVLELGGNAACIVDRDADPDDVVRRLVFGAFYQSGQSCISVQRIIIHTDIYRELRERLVSAARRLTLGDPESEDTFLGPLISEKEGERLSAWVDSAVAAGARLLCGARRDGALMEATLLEGVPRSEPLYCEEAFGPVAVLSRFDSFDDALAEANDSKYGINAGVFTNDMNKVLRAWDTLEVGAVVVNDVPSWRVDHMPYGGVKHSGMGREGIRFSMDAMSDLRLLVIRG